MGGGKFTFHHLSGSPPLGWRVAYQETFLLKKAFHIAGNGSSLVKGISRSCLQKFTLPTKVTDSLHESFAKFWGNQFFFGGKQDPYIPLEPSKVSTYQKLQNFSNVDLQTDYSFKFFFFFFFAEPEDQIHLKDIRIISMIVRKAVGGSDWRPIAVY